MKAIRVETPLQVELEGFQVNVIFELSKVNIVVCIDYIKSVKDLTDNEAKFLMDDVRATRSGPGRYSYDKSYIVIEVTDAEYSLVRMLYSRPESLKVTAIKFMKEQYGLRLKEAKDLCDQIGYGEPQ